jgi:hypothetical protein
MAIAEANLVTATGDTTNQSTPYSLGSVTPSADRLIIVVAAITAAGDLAPQTIGGTLAASWSEVLNMQHLGNNRRLGIWAALTGPSGIGTGTITIGNSAATAMTGIAFKASQFSGVYMGSNPLESIYGLGLFDSSGVTSLKASPVPPYAAAGDATLAVISFNVNAAITCERTEIGDAGYGSPTHRLGVQWYLGDDSDGPNFSWTGSAVAQAASMYLRDSANPPPAPEFKPYPVTVTV